MSSSALPVPPTSVTPTSPGLSPNTRAEAEAAFTYNALYQTASAAHPQPITPLTEMSQPMLPVRGAPSSSGASNGNDNYLHAASAAGFTIEPPYPSDGTAEQVKGTLSRGTTQAVLRKMDSAGSADGFEFGGTVLGKRVSREGERRTSRIPVPNTDGSAAVNGAGAEAGKEPTGMVKPGFDRQVSWSKEDMKRVMQERLMKDEAGSGENAGYSSVG